jgi:histidine ammonia-lyase
VNYNAVEIAKQQRQDHLRDAQREQLARHLVPQPSLYRGAMLKVAAMLVSVGRRLQAPALDGGHSLKSGMAG